MRFIALTGPARAFENVRGDRTPKPLSPTLLASPAPKPRRRYAAATRRDRSAPGGPTASGGGGCERPTRHQWGRGVVSGAPRPSSTAGRPQHCGPGAGPGETAGPAPGRYCREPDSRLLSSHLVDGRREPPHALVDLVDGDRRVREPQRVPAPVE